MTTTPAISGVLDMIRRKLDPETAAIIESALTDSARMAVIRDAFLEGRDHEAVMMIKELDPIGIRTFIGISSRELVDPLQTVQIALRPQLPFRGTRLLVSSACTGFVIAELRVGMTSLLPMSCDTPADLFTVDIAPLEAVLPSDDSGEDCSFSIKIAKSVEGRLGLPIDMPVCQPGQEIYLIVTNAGPTSTLFRGALLGTISNR